MTDLELLQKTLDADKWYESEKKGRDVCGEFPFSLRFGVSSLLREG